MNSSLQHPADASALGSTSMCDAGDGQTSSDDIVTRQLTVLSYHADFSGDDGEGVITWTFFAPKPTRVGAGLYELRHIRALMPEEFDMAPAAILQRVPASPEPVSPNASVKAEGRNEQQTPPSGEGDNPIQDTEA